MAVRCTEVGKRETSYNTRFYRNGTPMFDSQKDFHKYVLIGKNRVRYLRTSVPDSWIPSFRYHEDQLGFTLCPWVSVIDR